MYEAEIDESLDSGDLSALWHFMLKRTAWMQQSALGPEELTAAQADTERIAGRIEAISHEIESQLNAARKQKHVAQAYQGQWKETSASD